MLIGALSTLEDSLSGLFTRIGGQLDAAQPSGSGTSGSEG
jgi:hypothetical protein